MKRWQVEQILYLNDMGKSKLALPESHIFPLQTHNNQKLKKDSLVVVTLRRFFNFFANVL